MPTRSPFVLSCSSLCSYLREYSQTAFLAQPPAKWLFNSVKLQRNQFHASRRRDAEAINLIQLDLLFRRSDASPSPLFVCGTQMRLLLHLQNYAGKVLLGSFRQLFRINLESRFCRRHPRTEGSREFENQAEALIHEPQWKLRRVVVFHRSLEFPNVRGGDNGGLGHHVEQAIAIETSLFTECNGFGDRLHSDSQQAVDDKLHAGPGAARPHIKPFSRHHAEDRFGGVEAILVSAPEKDERSLLGGWRAPRYGHVEHVHPKLRA